MFDISDCDRIHSTHGDAVIVDPAELQGYPNRFKPQAFSLISFIHAPYRYAVKTTKY